jgi:hypothetical protein
MDGSQRCTQGCTKGAGPGSLDSAAIRALYPIVVPGVDVKDFAHTRESQGEEFERSGPSLRMSVVCLTLLALVISNPKAFLS